MIIEDIPQVSVFLPEGEDITKFFSYHHYHEVYDENKDYNSELFYHNYGHGTSRYRWKFYSFSSMSNIGEIIGDYMAVEEVLSCEQLDELSKFCRCAICRAKWYNISKYFKCRCCYGCLKAGVSYATQRAIDEAKRERARHMTGTTIDTEDDYSTSSSSTSSSFSSTSTDT
jgi:hypothetical protein